MVHPEKHLLEAFQETGARAPQPPAPAQAARGSAYPATASRGESALWLRALVVLVVAFGCFVLGRWSMMLPKDAQAAEPAKAPARKPVAANPSTSTSGNSAVAQPKPAPAQPTAAAAKGADAALLDPNNRWTLLAVTYGNSPANRELARSTAEYLRKQGLPAAEPVQSGKNVVVLVGAAPTSGGLFELQTALRALPGPSGRARDFATAYPVDINSWLERGAP